MARRIGRLLVAASVVAVLAGVVYGLVRDDVVAGIVNGVIWGIGAVILGLMDRDSSAMDDLNQRQRQEIRRRLRRGEPVDDPKLAPALVERANDILANPVMPKGSLIVAGVFFAFGAVATGFAIPQLGLRSLVVGMPLFLLALLFLTYVWLSGSRRGLVEQSLRLTEDRLQGNDS
ncbi:hypothetical protein [Kibdelosporangium aridum]|uniref:Uncharacterized protein n=1 Tax=Kibdelosporangium aridum TaxID=2030 RepID=A0A1W2FIH0_KIBAR|nr:hypothetical protein [Kibdelosporangium aridum]SMD21747.1 hypothetical protein SAMN05661093_07031 [Kibdelosporangium aridum]